MKEKTGLLLRALLQAALVGICTGVLLCFYKLLAKQAVTFAKSGYGLLQQHLWVVLPILAVFLGIAFLLSLIYRRIPTLKGGGIPTSICAIKGLTYFNGFKNLVGVFTLSLGSFLMGLPLGTEGPSVQMGTAMGDILSKIFGKKDRVDNLTAGACAGFTVATGAPISGLLFSVEEAHKKISGKQIATAATAVTFAAVINHLLSPMLHISIGLFEGVTLPTLDANQLWLPALCGAVMGLFSVGFLHYYTWIKKLAELPKPTRFIKLFLVFALTLLMGILSFDMISTGHDLIFYLGQGHYALWMILLILFVRTTLTLSANTCGCTGGIFLPLLAIGATASAALASICISLGMDQRYYLFAVMLGMVGCVAGMMKMPLTAVVFALEALSLQTNLLSVMITAVLTFIITEIFRVKSITEIIVEHRETAPRPAAEPSLSR